MPLKRLERQFSTMGRMSSKFAGRLGWVTSARARSSPVPEERPSKMSARGSPPVAELSTNAWSISSTFRSSLRKPTKRPRWSL